MSGLDCFKGNLEMSAKVKAYMKRDMPELEASVRVVEEEHKILHNDLNDFRKSIGKSEIKYTAPDLSAAVEKIQTKYNNKIEGLKDTYEFIPSETQYAALKRLTAKTTDMTAEEVVSDASTGAYSVSSVGLGQNYYVRAYKSGAPDVAGTSRNDLTGTT